MGKGCNVGESLDLLEEVLDQLRPLILQILNEPLQIEKRYISEKILAILGVVAQNHNWISPKFLSERSDLEGTGVFLREGEYVQKGELIAVFGGKVHTLEQGFDLPDSLNMGHILVHPNFSIGASVREEVDDGDYFNHSCDPTCGIKGQICLYALKEMVPGDEATFDYGTIFGGFDIEHLPENMPREMIDQGTGIITLFSECHCGSGKCRGKVTSDDWKNIRSNPLLLGCFSPHIQNLIDNYSSRI